MALLDSGADYTEIPTDIVSSLGLQPQGERPVDRKDGSPAEKQRTYLVDIVLDGVTFKDVLVSASDKFTVDGRPWVLIGRDILDDGVVLDGPNKWFTVSDPKGASISPVPPVSRSSGAS